MLDCKAPGELSCSSLPRKCWGWFWSGGILALWLSPASCGWFCALPSACCESPWAASCVPSSPLKAKLFRLRLGCAFCLEILCGAAFHRTETFFQGSSVWCFKCPQQSPGCSLAGEGVFSGYSGLWFLSTWVCLVACGSPDWEWNCRGSWPLTLLDVSLTCCHPVGFIFFVCLVIIDIRCALLLTHKKPFPGSGLLTHFMKWACKLYGFGQYCLTVVRGSFGFTPPAHPCYVEENSN